MEAKQSEEHMKRQKEKGTQQSDRGHLGIAPKRGWCEASFVVSRRVAWGFIRRGRAAQGRSGETEDWEDPNMRMPTRSYCWFPLPQPKAAIDSSQYAHTLDSGEGITVINCGSQIARACVLIFFAKSKWRGFSFRPAADLRLGRNAWQMLDPQGGSASVRLTSFVYFVPLIINTALLL